ncbi:MAG: lipoprotein [Mesorhizobium sp.]|nr:lipoprotein [Mesorhizobium sp.]
MSARPFLTVLIVLAVASVSACGRRAALDRPADVRYEQERQAAKKAGLPAPEKPSNAVPERPFILDGLID